MIGPRPFIASEIIIDKVDSTSNLARRHVQEGRMPLPLLVVARRQTKGRGQGTNLWWSDEGSLTFTLAFDPVEMGLSAKHEPLLALATALAIIETIDRHVPPTLRLGIRWPNDIEVDHRKLGGILPERVDHDGRSAILIGVGLNVRTQLADAPREVQALACSLAEFGPAPEIDDLLRSLIEAIEISLKRLASNDPSLAERWAELDMLLGRAVKVQMGERLLIGVGAGFSADGALLVANDDGVEEVFGGRVLREP